MKYTDMQEGMIVNCIGDYADCIHSGKQYTIYKSNNELYVNCDVGKHYLLSSLTDSCEFPEFTS